MFRAVGLQWKGNCPALDHLGKHEPRNFARGGSDFFGNFLAFVTRARSIRH